MKKITALAAAALAALTLTGTAAAAPSPTEDAHIWLTVTRTTTDGVSHTGNIWIDCPGIQGTGHPQRESACTDLDYADGDFNRLPGRSEANCWAGITEVVATAHGVYEGREVHWEQTYESECDLILATGKIFDF